MKVRFFNPSLWYLQHKKEIDSEISRVLSAGDLILRSDVEKFEENLANFVGTKYAVALNSGTDALVLALKSAGVTGGAVVGVPSHTFKATCGAVITADGMPYVYDVGGIAENIYSINIPVHIAGELSPMPRHGIVIEDAAQALGAVKNPSSFAQCWSFYPAKILGAYGDAGGLTTNNKEVYEYVREARNHFKNDNSGFGINSRMDNLQAAILNVKFKYLPSFLARREEIAQKYKALEGVELPNYQEGRVWQDYIIRLPARYDMSEDKYEPDNYRRDKLYEFLKENGIETMKNEYPWTPEFSKPPLAAKYEAETLRIPCNPDLTSEEVDFVIEKINAFGLL